VAVVTEMGALSVWDRIPDGWRFSILEWAGSSRVFDVDWDAVGERLLTVSEDTRIDIWDAANLRGERVELWYTSESAAWSPSGNFVAIGDHSHERVIDSPFVAVLAVVDFETYRERGSGILPSGIVNALAWPPDESVIAAACSDGTVRMWTGFGQTDDRSSWFDEVYRFTVDVPVIDLAWSPDGSMLAAGDEEGTIWVWRIPEVIE
jgi:WD40 repeat protein